MFREQEGSRGIIYLKHNTEQKSDIQLVALSNFTVISAEYHAGLADTGMKNRVGPQKKIRPGILCDAMGSCFK